MSDIMKSQRVRSTQGVFAHHLQAFRPGFWEVFKIQRQEVCADVACLMWEAKPFVTMATDTLLVRDGKIHIQTFTKLG